MAIKNHFLQRFRRHATLATVLQANIRSQVPSQGLTVQQQRSAEISSQSPVAQAKLVSPHSDLPRGHILGSPPAQASLPSFPKGFPQRPAMTPRQPAPPTDVKPGKSVQKREAPGKTVVPPRPADSTDKNWRRLQTIIQRHQSDTGSDPSEPVSQKTAAETEAPALHTEPAIDRGADEKLPDHSPAETPSIQATHSPRAETEARSVQPEPRSVSRPPSETSSDAITVISRSQIQRDDPIEQSKFKPPITAGPDQPGPDQVKPTVPPTTPQPPPTTDRIGEFSDRPNKNR